MRRSRNTNHFLNRASSLLRRRSTRNTRNPPSNLEIPPPPPIEQMNDVPPPPPIEPMELPSPPDIREMNTPRLRHVNTREVNRFNLLQDIQRGTTLRRVYPHEMRRPRRIQFFTHPRRTNANPPPHRQTNVLQNHEKNKEIKSLLKENSSLKRKVLNLTKEIDSLRREVVHLKDQIRRTTQEKEKSNENVSLMNQEDLPSFLKRIKFEKLLPFFQKDNAVLEDLEFFEDEDLRECGLKPYQSKRFLNEIKKLFRKEEEDEMEPVC